MSEPARTLYDIGADLTLVEQALVEAQDDQAIALLEQYLAELGTEREQKLDAYCGLIRELASRSEARAAEADRLRALAVVDRNAADRLKARLLDHFRQHGIQKVETDHFRISRAKAGGKAALELDPIPVQELPDQFVQMALAPDTASIRAALERGEVLPFARLKERGEHLRIS